MKICGITNLRDLQIAVEAGADALGFVVGASKSPRNLSLRSASELLGEVPPFVASVAVTVFSNQQSIRRMVERLEPDFLQIHGGQTSQILGLRDDADGVCLIRALDLQDPLLEEELSMLEGFEAVLLDSTAPDGYGGTGRLSDLTQAFEIGEKLGSTPLILAGGLNPSNVALAIEKVHPYAVDVSSGVEAEPGRKDADKLRRFIARAKGFT